LASITPGIESNPGKENAGIKTPSPLLMNDWFSIGRVERSSRMGGKFDPEHFGIERNVVAHTSAPALCELDRLRRRWRAVDKPVAFLHDDLHRFRIDHPLFSAKTNRRFPPVALPRLDTSTSLSIERDAVERRRSISRQKELGGFTNATINSTDRTVVTSANSAISAH